jgi:hypothetical protein
MEYYQYGGYEFETAIRTSGHASGHSGLKGMSVAEVL